jgi:hypothetical protein
MIEKFLRSVLLVAGMAFSPAATPQSPAAAASPVYNVELIVFRSLSGPASGEDWSADVSVRSGGTGDAAGAAQVGRFIAAIPAGEFQLKAEDTKLAASGAYEPIAHFAWRQTASSWGSRAGFSLTQLGGAASGLSGLVYLERGAYLHLGLSLRFASGGTSYRLNEVRRVKFYEKNYYDHPAFGVIALVTPAQGARPPGR